MDMDMNYTEDQLRKYVEKVKTDRNMKSVLMSLEGKELSTKEVGDDVGLSVYPRDKAILALEFAGFIQKRGLSSAKLYQLTNIGIELLRMVKGRK